MGTESRRINGRLWRYIRRTPRESLLGPATSDLALGERGAEQSMHSLPAGGTVETIRTDGEVYTQRSTLRQRAVSESEKLK